MKRNKNDDRKKGSRLRCGKSLYFRSNDQSIHQLCYHRHRIHHHHHRHRYKAANATIRTIRTIKSVVSYISRERPTGSHLWNISICTSTHTSKKHWVSEWVVLDGKWTTVTENKTTKTNNNIITTATTHMFPQNSTVHTIYTQHTHIHFIIYVYNTIHCECLYRIDAIVTQIWLEQHHKYQCCRQPINYYWKIHSVYDA